MKMSIIWGLVRPPLVAGKYKIIKTNKYHFHRVCAEVVGLSVGLIEFRDNE